MSFACFSSWCLERTVTLSPLCYAVRLPNKARPQSIISSRSHRGTTREPPQVPNYARMSLQKTQRNITEKLLVVFASCFSWWLVCTAPLLFRPSLTLGSRRFLCLRVVVGTASALLSPGASSNPERWPAWCHATVLAFPFRFLIKLYPLLLSTPGGAAVGAATNLFSQSLTRDGGLRTGGLKIQFLIMLNI